MHLPTAWLLKIVGDVRASYWFVPAMLVVAAMVTAQGMFWLDRHPEVLPLRLPSGMIDTQVAGARAVLSVIASATIGVAGVMFSVTIVAVSFASGKYGPRLIGNFMRDRGNQWSLGILISTFVYALLVLREVQGGTQAEVFVPQHAVVLAIAMSLISVATVIYYVHHVPETMDVSRITAALGKRLCLAVKTPDLPAPHAPPPDKSAPDKSTSVGSNDRGGQTETDIAAPCPGYIQTIDTRTLAEVATQTGAQVTLLTPPGRFVARNEPIARIALADPPHSTITALLSAIAIGDTPTEAQNSAFLAQQLVEMLARALSPGVNDPFTAINCLNWLHSALLTKLEAEAAAGDAASTEVSTEANDEAGDKGSGAPPSLVSLPQHDFSDLLRESHGSALSYVKTDPLARAHMVLLLDRLHARASGPDRAAVTRLKTRLTED